MPAFLVGAEKAAVAAVTAFIPTAGLGYLVVGDWRGLLYGVGSAALSGVATYLKSNTPTPDGKHEATS